MKKKKAWMLERVRTRHISQAAAMAKEQQRQMPLKPREATPVTLERLEEAFRRHQQRYE